MWYCGFFGSADFEYCGFWVLRILSRAGFWDCGFWALRILSIADPEYDPFFVCHILKFSIPFLWTLRPCLFLHWSCYGFLLNRIFGNYLTKTSICVIAVQDVFLLLLILHYYWYLETLSCCCSLLVLLFLGIIFLG